jgi:hypothetical protein
VRYCVPDRNNSSNNNKRMVCSYDGTWYNINITNWTLSLIIIKVNNRFVFIASLFLYND